MIKISALNDSSSESNNADDIEPSEEALEAAATRLYRNAISYIAHGEAKKAQECFLEVLRNPYTEKVRRKDSYEGLSLPQEVLLKYSCYKNLGNIYMEEKKYQDACNFYLKAVQLDSSEVTLWHKLGLSAIKINDFELSVIAFQEGLQVNPSHWPCLDQLLSVLFLLGFYDDCLGLAIHALKRDGNYLKALAFKDKIFELNPSLVMFAKEFYVESDILFRDVPYDKTKGDVFIATCLALRPPPKEPFEPTKIPTRNLLTNLEKLNWIELATSLIQTYDHLMNEEANAVAAKIELENHISYYIKRNFGLGVQHRGMRPGKRLNRSLSCDGEIVKFRFSEDQEGPKGRISARRQTIELGGDFESFRVGVRKSIFTDRDRPAFQSVSRSNVLQHKSDISLKAPGSSNRGPEKESLDKVIEGSPMESSGMEVLENPKEDLGKHKRAVDKIFPSTEDLLSNTCGDDLLRSESTAAGVKTDEAITEDLGKVKEKGDQTCRSEKSVGGNSDSCDNSVFTAAELKPEDNNLEKDAFLKEGSADADKTLTEGEISNDVEKLNISEAAVNQFNDIMSLKAPSEILGLPLPGFDFEDPEFSEEYFDGGVFEEEDADLQDPPRPVKAEGKEDSEKSAQRETKEEMLSEAPANEPVKKQKRAKRGLERELEQLDYWGRRKAREAKRRRRTLTSKLVKVFEESEYLTWAHLLRSFIPADLLSDSSCRRQSEENSAQGSVDETSLTKLAGSEFVSCSLLSGNEVKASSHSDVSKDQFKFFIDFCPTCDITKWDLEQLEVAEFLYELRVNGGIIDVMQKFQNLCLEKWDRVWPLSFALAYKNVYGRVRKHIVVGATLSVHEDPKRLYDYARAALTHLELLISIFRVSDSVSLLQEEPCFSPEEMFLDEELHIEDDIFNLGLLLGRPDIWKEEYLQAHLRLRWVQSQIQMALGNPEIAATQLTFLIEEMQISTRDEAEPLTVACCKVQEDKPALTVAYLKDQLNILQRSQILETIQDKFKEGLYEEVIGILTSLFDKTPSGGFSTESACPSRPAQLIMLVEALVKTDNILGVMEWGSKCLLESLESYKNIESETDEEKTKWSSTVESMLEAFLSLFRRRPSLDGQEIFTKLPDFVSPLVDILVLQLEQSLGNYPYFNTLSPWLLMHYILSEHEQGRIMRGSHSEDKTEAEGSSSKDIEERTEKDTSSSKDNEGKTEAERSSAKDSESKKEAEGSSAKDSESKKEAEGSSTKDNMGKTEAEVCTSKEKKIEVDDSGVKESESKMEAEGSGSSKDNEDDQSPFPSTLLLITAHEEFGKNGWCCHEGGILLYHMLDVLLMELNRPLSDEQRVLLHHSLEQVIFCLYNHPSRKSKASIFLSGKHKHLRDHGVQSHSLRWDRALQLYKYYVPSQLPEFQSSHISSISDDVASLLKKVVAILPNEFRHSNQTECIDSYLRGDSKDFLPSEFPFPSELTDCYYLLGDFFFKGKEWDQAIFYYKLDISVSPNRLDSWAPMGLAKKAQLETLLNSCDVIENEEVFFKDAEMAERCLRKALQLDQLHSNLWVEKGGLVYMIHSHASRLLKQDLNPDLSMERFEVLEKVKEKAMKEAELCFTEAMQIVEAGLDDETLPDERWLYQYMLGKLAEKSFKPPEEVLKHYLMASDFLHQIRAKYPNKISYNNPSEYAVEALEAYFRIHTYIFKYLHQREGKEVDQAILEFFSNVISRVTQSPFVRRLEKKATQSHLDSDPLACKGSGEESDSSKRPLEEELTGQDPIKRPKIEDDVEAVAKVLVNEILEKAMSESLENPKSKRDDDILVVEERIEKKESYAIIMKCVEAWKLCVSRFPHHYKSLYRLAYYYHSSKFHKESVKAFSYLLGSECWQQLDYMPTNGLFHERKFYLQNPKNCNLFYGIWRIPHDEIDRPGSFAAHMYRCISLCLDILQDAKAFYTVLEVALSLKNSPDKDKKYLRDNERELLSHHSCQVGLQLMKDKFKTLFSVASPAANPKCHNFLIEVHKAYKYMSRHLSYIEAPVSKMLVDAYASLKNLSVQNNLTLLREADMYCMRNSLTKRPPPPPTQGGYRTAFKVTTPSQSTGTLKNGLPVLSGTPQLLPRQMRPSHSLAVQEAYKVYENIIQAQTLLNGKNLDSINVAFYQKKYEEYKKEMLKYLQIPSVSEFFHASLQKAGTPYTKLPPPPHDTSVASFSKTANPALDKHSLSSLAARSQAHGISISAVPRKAEVTVTKQSKPSMSITVSPTKSRPTPNLPKSPPNKSSAINFPLANIPKDISIVRTSSTKAIQSAAAGRAFAGAKVPPSSVMPKLPPGTTSSLVPKHHPCTTSVIPKHTPGTTMVPKLPPGTTTSVVTKLQPGTTTVVTKLLPGTTTSVVTKLQPGTTTSVVTKLPPGTTTSVVPKLPPGTTLSRPMPASKMSEASGSVSSKLGSAAAKKVPKGSVTKGSSISAFQNAFQASLANNNAAAASKSNTVDIIQLGKALSSVSVTRTNQSPSNNKPESAAKGGPQKREVVPLKFKDPLSMTEDEEEVITLD